MPNPATNAPLPTRTMAGADSSAVARDINDFVTSLSDLHTEDDILWDITRRCIANLGFEDCVVYLVDETRGVLIQRAAHGPKNPRDREIASPIDIPIGRGIVGSVARSGTAEIIPDTRIDPRYIVDDAFRLSEIAVPIVADGRVLGVIDAEHSRADFFTPEHLVILRSIAAVCAGKLVRARAEVRLRELNQDLERRIFERTTELVAANDHLRREVTERARAERVQRALFEMSEAAHAAEDLPRLYARIHEIIGTLMPARNFYIAVLDEASGLISFPYHCDLADPPPPPRKPRRGMTEYVLRTGRAALADLHEIQRLKDAGEYVQTGHPSAIWLGVPLTVGGRTFGVMAVQDQKDPTAFGEEEKRILSFVAGQTALAIDRKRADENRRRAEQELLRTLARERELSRLKSSFVSLVSHEFRTPIGVIHSSAEILERYLPLLPEAERLEHLKAIQSHSWRMAALMEDVLVFGRVEAGRLEFRPSTFDLTEACRRWTEEILRTTDHRCPIRLIIELGLPTPFAQGDPDLLRHIVTNLLSNAVKYSPDGGAIDFIVERDEGIAVFRIEDRGLGIPAADLDRLFTAFQRGSNVSHLPGTGLGLAVIRHCLDLHRGRIELTSQEGLGTRATVRIPLFLPTFP